MSDKIFISGIDCVGAIGVSPEERTLRQRLSVDVELETDIGPAARSDSIKDALDYSEIVPMVSDVVAGREFHLIETLAEAIAERILVGFGPDSVRVVVRKTPVLSSPIRFVSVEIVRSRS